MRSFILLLLIGFALAAGNVPPEGLVVPVQTLPALPGTAVVLTAEEESPIAPSSTMTVASSPTPLASPTAAEPSATPAPDVTPSPIAIEQLRATTSAELVEVMPPLRDQIELAVAYRGIEAIVATQEPITELHPGIFEDFFISNVESNTVSVIEAELMSVGENAYFWFDRGDGSGKPDEAALAVATQRFDEVFNALFPNFGTGEHEGERVHIVHASPSRLCENADQCGLAGYFSSRDQLPGWVDPQSNERKMFVMNARQFGSATYIDTLSHELRHLLGSAYDLGDEDWFIEGAAMLAEDLLGFTTLPQYRANQFLSEPDLQLNSWQEENTGPRYGQGYLVNRFLYDRLGPDLYREYTLSRRPGLMGVDEIAAANGLEITGERLWLDWLASMALLDVSDVPEQYRWDGPSLEPIAMTAAGVPENIRTAVHQYAADYYELPAGAATIEFTGRTTVPLLGSAAPSGDYFWYAQRANSSNPRLTRSVDLRDAAGATLHYRVYADIEAGYDFAYVSASIDDGRTWQPLAAEGMQGLDAADDPSGTALADRFYTGRVGKWVEEAIDLSPYSGREILLRFEYVTDLILTYGGFAIDDIVIPEIGLLDDAEAADSSWIAEGFTRATADLPQSWRPQLITFDAGGRPSVERLDVSDDGRLTFDYETVPGARRPILIIAAVAPETLQPAEYELTINLR